MYVFNIDRIDCVYIGKNAETELFANLRIGGDSVQLSPRETVNLIAGSANAAGVPLPGGVSEPRADTFTVPLGSQLR